MNKPTFKMHCQTCPLHTAASANNTREIGYLLLGANDISKIFMLNVARNEKGQTPLHAAVESNCFEATIMLIKEGCDVHAQDDKGDTILHIAVRKNFAQISLQLLNLWGDLDVKDIQNEDGNTAFHVAILTTTWNLGISDIKTYIRQMSTAVFNSEGYSPFHLAIKLNKKELVKAFLYLQPQLSQQLSGNGEPPLWVALKHRHLDMMEMLLQNGMCDINQKNTKIGAPAIWLAIYRQDEEAIELLLESPGFDRESVDASSLDGTSPLLLAMIKGNEKQLDQLISMSANKNKWEAIAQKIMFAMATEADFKTFSNNIKMLKTTEYDGNTFLHLAVLSDSLEMVKGVVTAAGSRHIEHAIDLACERQCADIINYLTGILGAEIDNKKTISNFSVAKKFPRFSDAFEDLFDPLKEANESSLMVEVNSKGQILYLHLMNYVIPKSNINFIKASDIEIDINGLPVSIPHLSHLLPQLKELNNDQNTAMLMEFLSILMHVETYLKREDQLFMHLGVVLLPVGSTVEGTKVSRLNELDIMLFCTDLHGFLTVEDEQTIFISEDKYNNLPMIIRDLFDMKTKILDMAKFFTALMHSIKRAIKDLVARNMLPNNVEVFLDGSKCSEIDCKANAGQEWSQCHHKEPPCICYTAVGAGLNFIWKGEKDMNLVFTIDIVPNFYVDLNGLSNFTLRQKLIKYLLNHKPFGWVGFLKKYIRDDRIYMGQYDLEEKSVASVGLKMVNTRGDFVIRPGLNMHVQAMLEDKIIHETYCFLKVLKTLTASKAKSFDIKKAISDQLRGSRVEKPGDVFAFARQVIFSPDLRGKFNELCQPLAERYLKMDLVHFPVKNSSNLAIHLISKEASDLLRQILMNNLEGFRQLLQTVGRSTVEDMLINGRSLLHYAVERFNVNMVRDLLLAGCDVNFKDLEGNTALHSLLSISRSFSTFFESEQPTMRKRFESDALEEASFDLQNNKGETVFHLLALTNLGPLAEDLLLSKASGVILDLADYSGMTAAMRACSYNGFKRKEDIILCLIKKGANVHASNNLGYTLLHSACRNCSHILVDHLLSRGAKVNARDKEGFTPLMFACDSGNFDVVELLLRRGTEADAVDNDGKTGCYYATINGHLDVVRLLVQQSGNINASGDDLLFSALKAGQFEVAKFLLNSGIDVNRSDITGMTPLAYAAQEGLVEIVRLLINHGATINPDIDNGVATMDPCKRYSDVIPLYIASQLGHLEVVRLLLENGADPNLEIGFNSDGTTEGNASLFIASSNGHLEIVRLLLKAGANVDQLTSENGQSPLLAACFYGHINIVRLLLSYSTTNINQPNKLNGSPLFAAAEKGHADIVALLLDNNADTRIAYQGRFTPLHIACRGGHLQVVKLLVEAGATVEELYLKIAIDNNHEAIVEYLSSRNS